MNAMKSVGSPATGRMAPVFISLVVAAMTVMSGCSRTPHDPVGHVTKVNAKPWSTDCVPEAAVVEVSPPAEAKRQQVAKHGGRVAFLVRNDNVKADAMGRPGQSELIYFIVNNHCYRVDGVPFGDKPVTGLAWSNERYLQFDRWPQSHYGMHFVVDTRAKQIVHATPFPDASTIAFKEE